MDAAQAPLQVSFEFTPTKDDYVSAVRAQQLRSRSVRVFLIVLAVMFVLTLYIVIVRNQEMGYLWYWLLVFPLYVFSVFVRTPYSIGRQVQQSERMSAHQIWQMDDSQIEIKTRFSDAKMDWGTFDRVVETRNFYLLFLSANKSMFHVLPRRAFTSADQEAGFRALLQRHIAKLDLIA